MFTIDDFQRLFAYNTWANRQFFDALNKFPEPEYMAERNTSHGGIHGTLLHLVAGERIWVDRWMGISKPKLLSRDVGYALLPLRAVWECAYQDLDLLLKNLTDRQLHIPMTIHTTDGGEYVHTLAHMMQHLANHSTYHRGQIASMMRQCGTVPPATDLIIYLRIPQ